MQNKVAAISRMLTGHGQTGFLARYKNDSCHDSGDRGDIVWNNSLGICIE